MNSFDSQKWLKLLITAAFALTSAVAFSAVAGCDDDVDSAGDVGDRIDDAAEDTRDAAEDAADDLEDAADNAGNELEDAVDN